LVEELDIMDGLKQAYFRGNIPVLTDYYI